MSNHLQFLIIKTMFHNHHFKFSNRCISVGSHYEFTWFVKVCQFSTLNDTQILTMMTTMTGTTKAQINPPSMDIQQL